MSFNPDERVLIGCELAAFTLDGRIVQRRAKYYSSSCLSRLFASRKKLHWFNAPRRLMSCSVIITSGKYEIVADVNPLLNANIWLTKQNIPVYRCHIMYEKYNISGIYAARTFTSLDDVIKCLERMYNDVSSGSLDLAAKHFVASSV